MLNFDFLDKDLGIVSPAHFVYDFPRKISLMLYSIENIFINVVFKIETCS